MLHFLIGFLLSNTDTDKYHQPFWYHPSPPTPTPTKIDMNQTDLRYTSRKNRKKTWFWTFLALATCEDLKWVNLCVLPLFPLFLQLRKEARLIYNTYLSDSSFDAVNIDDTARIDESALEHPVTSMFQKAQDQVLTSDSCDYCDVQRLICKHVDRSVRGVFTVLYFKT